MLEIQEKFDSNGYESILALTDNNNIHITEAKDGDEVIGFIAYAYTAEQTIVYGYDDGNDLMLCDGLVRSVMLKSALKGIETISFEPLEKEKLSSLVKLKFLAEGSSICENIDGFLNACDHCKNK